MNKEKRLYLIVSILIVVLTVSFTQVAALTIRTYYPPFDSSKSWVASSSGTVYTYHYSSTSSGRIKGSVIACSMGSYALIKAYMRKYIYVSARQYIFGVKVHIKGYLSVVSAGYLPTGGLAYIKVWFKVYMGPTVYHNYIIYEKSFTGGYTGSGINIDTIVTECTPWTTITQAGTLTLEIYVEIYARKDYPIGGQMIANFGTSSDDTKFIDVIYFQKIY